MNYKYGVEYKWCGSNSLPENIERDCVVDVRFPIGSNLTGNAGRFNWMMVSAFKIIDERYKTVEKDNTWFERGELPPVGTICKAYHEGSGEWLDAEVLKHRVNSAANNVAVAMGIRDFKLFWFSASRPIRTDREKAIEAAKAALLKKGSLAIITNLETLYDAGLLRLPEEK